MPEWLRIDDGLMVSLMVVESETCISRTCWLWDIWIDIGDESDFLATICNPQRTMTELIKCHLPLRTTLASRGIRNGFCCKRITEFWKTRNTTYCNQRHNLRIEKPELYTPHRETFLWVCPFGCFLLTLPTILQVKETECLDRVELKNELSDLAKIWWKQLEMLAISGFNQKLQKRPKTTCPASSRES